MSESGNTRDRRVALCLAASYLEGDKQQALLKDAESLSHQSGTPLRNIKITGAGNDPEKYFFTR